MKYCEKCGSYIIFEDSHRCPPIFEVLDPDYSGDEWEEVYAYDYEQAAEKAAEKHDSDGGEGAAKHTFQVRKKGDGEIKLYDVDFDYSVVYSAYEKP